MNETESLKVFCMRLEDAALKAFPRNPKRQSREIKKKLSETAPDWFVTLLEKKKEIKELMKIGKSISWGEIIELAEEQDKKRKIPKNKQGKGKEDNGNDEINRRYVAAAQGQAMPSQMQAPRQTQASSQIRAPAPMRATNGNFRTSVPQCSQCQKRGHTWETCWARTGACILCGSRNHLFRGCPRYYPNQTINRESRPPAVEQVQRIAEEGSTTRQNLNG